jgi:heme O synthase-like polyprenyltransferase
MAIMAHSGLRESLDEGRLLMLSAIDAKPETPSLAKDLQVLTKLRLNTFVVITTLFGFFLAAKGAGGWPISGGFSSIP